MAHKGEPAHGTIVGVEQVGSGRRHADRVYLVDGSVLLGSAGSPGHASPSERIATLADLLSRGQITEQEFQARRQQILDEI